MIDFCTVTKNPVRAYFETKLRNLQQSKRIIKVLIETDNEKQSGGGHVPVLSNSFLNFSDIKELGQTKSPAEETSNRFNFKKKKKPAIDNSTNKQKKSIRDRDALNMMLRVNETIMNLKQKDEIVFNHAVFNGNDKLITHNLEEQLENFNKRLFSRKRASLNKTDEKMGKINNTTINKDYLLMSQDTRRTDSNLTGSKAKDSNLIGSKTKESELINVNSLPNDNETFDFMKEIKLEDENNKLQMVGVKDEVIIKRFRTIQEEDESLVE